MKRLFFTLIGAVVLLSSVVSCTSINSSDGGSMALYPKTVGPIDCYRPLYKVDETKRVSGKAKTNVLFGLFVWGDDAAIADNASIAESNSWYAWFADLFPSAKKLAAKAAFYNACKKANCDAVVSARYEVENKNYFIFSQCTAEIKGFPAVQTGVETIKIMPYYLDSEGKMVKLDRFVIPVEILNLKISEGFIKNLF